MAAVEILPPPPVDLGELDDVMGVYRGARRPNAGMAGVQEPVANWLDDNYETLVAELILLRNRDALPDPAVWPECSMPGCGTTYRLARVYVVGTGQGWVWLKSCMHKPSAAYPPTMRTRDSA